MKNNEMSELEELRHSAAHVMAAAICRIYPNVKLDIGPPTSEGFYYDMDLDTRITPDDFEKIEKVMQEIINEDHPFEYREVTREEAVKILSEQPYKIERLSDIPEDEIISFYKCGEFNDLCRGTHIQSTGKIKSFKISHVSGSYYRGKETNPMLQRLYGTAFFNPKDMRQYLKQIEEAKKRDHRKLANELDLFSISETVGPGLVNWHPKGARIRSIIEDF